MESYRVKADLGGMASFDCVAELSRGVGRALIGAPLTRSRYTFPGDHPMNGRRGWPEAAQEGGRP